MLSDPFDIGHSHEIHVYRGVFSVSPTLLLVSVHLVNIANLYTEQFALVIGQQGVSIAVFQLIFAQRSHIALTILPIAILLTPRQQANVIDDDQ